MSELYCGEKMNERIRWIDYAKGIAASLVLIGHFVPLRSLQIFIYSFHRC